jgi:peptidoglycan/LPS O-acetylase OafA/YrhL
MKAYLSRLNIKPSIPVELESNIFPSLNGFRAISILMVVFSHIFFTEHVNIFLRLFSGEFGVHFFFVISGLLITTLLLKEKSKTDHISLKRFYIRRFLRIFPVAYLFLLSLIILNYFFNLNVSLSEFISSFLYIRNTSILPVSDWYTGHYWSLSVEEQFYILFPFILRTNIRVYFFTILLIICSIPIINYLDVHKLINSYSFHLLNQFLRNMSAILIGSLFSILIFFKFIRIIIIQKFRLIFSLLLFMMAAFIHCNFFTFIPSSISPTLSSVIIVLLIIVNLTPSNDLFYKFLNFKFISFLGVLSYSIYIWQQLFTSNMPWQNSFPGSNSIFFNLLMLFLVSYCSYYFYERRFLKLKDRFES